MTQVNSDVKTTNVLTILWSVMAVMTALMALTRQIVKMPHLVDLENAHKFAR